MGFLTEQMPRRIAAGFTVGPRWSTLVVPLANGREQRNGNWLFPKWEARANFAAFNTADQQALLNLFMACRGRLHAFRFYDPLEHTATNQPLVTVGGVTYLSKQYTYGGETATRLIQAPITATLSGAGTVDMDTGIVTGAADGDTWSGTFDVWMRFDSDLNSYTAEAINAWKADIDLIEVRR